MGGERGGRGGQARKIFTYFLFIYAIHYNYNLRDYNCCTKTCIGKSANKQIILLQNHSGFDFLLQIFYCKFLQSSAVHQHYHKSRPHSVCKAELSADSAWVQWLDTEECDFGTQGRVCMLIKECQRTFSENSSSNQLFVSVV